MDGMTEGIVDETTNETPLLLPAAWSGETLAVNGVGFGRVVEASLYGDTWHGIQYLVPEIKHSVFPRRTFRESQIELELHAIHWLLESAYQLPAGFSVVGDRASVIVGPVKMILVCPRCSEDHVDAPNPDEGWSNPPHRSHLCHYCGWIWRPSDYPTMGVARSEVRPGERDSVNFVSPVEPS